METQPQNLSGGIQSDPKNWPAHVDAVQSQEKPAYGQAFDPGQIPIAGIGEIARAPDKLFQADTVAMAHAALSCDDPIREFAVWEVAEIYMRAKWYRKITIRLRLLLGLRSGEMCLTCYTRVCCAIRILKQDRHAKQNQHN
jgi:hypothetical protein